MSNATKLLLISASVLITTLVITVAVTMGKSSKRTAQAYSDKQADLYDEIYYSELEQVDGEEMYGADVTNYIKSHLSKYSDTEHSDIKFVVVTAITPTVISYSYDNRQYFKDMQNFTNARYINPMSKFLGSLTYNNNGVITEVKFTIQ